VKQKAVGL